MAYVTTAAVKTYLGITETDDDDLIADLIDSAEKAIDAYTDRHFEAATKTRYYLPGDLMEGDPQTLWLGDDLLALTSVANGDSDGTAIATTQFFLLPRNYGPPYHQLRLKTDSTSSWEWDTDCYVTIVGTWGYSTAAPDDIVQAARRLAAYYYRQKDSQVFDVTALPEQGVITVPAGIPADVKVLLGPYRKMI